MKYQKLSIAACIAMLCIAACQQQAETGEEETQQLLTEISDPCDNPKTVAELLACANTVGAVNSHSVSLGADFNGGACLKAWNDNDTVLTITYADSISVWRVGEWPEVSGNYSGHWFTNYSAKAKGLTKAEVLQLFALNTCSDFNWDSCVCHGTTLPPDTLIQYEDEVRIGPNRSFQFGIVGQNMFGSGGPIQWHLNDTIKPPFVLVQQIPWN